MKLFRLRRRLCPNVLSRHFSLLTLRMVEKTLSHFCLSVYLWTERDFYDVLQLSAASVLLFNLQKISERMDDKVLPWTFQERRRKLMLEVAWVLWRCFSSFLMTATTHEKENFKSLMTEQSWIKDCQSQIDFFFRRKQNFRQAKKSHKIVNFKFRQQFPLVRTIRRRH